MPNLNRERGEVAMVMGACLWTPKILWEELGGFPEWFGSIGEDLYLCCRARLAGYPVRALGGSGFRHQVGRSFGGGKVAAGRLATTYRRRALSERNKTFVMIVCQPALLLAVLLPLHLFLIHLEGLLVAVMKRDCVLWREIYAPLLPRLWIERGRLRAERSTIQATRTIALVDWLGPFRWLPWKLRMLFRHGLPEVKDRSS
jgi:GT2 family glycosyltransferase